MCRRRSERDTALVPARRRYDALRGFEQDGIGDCRPEPVIAVEIAPSFLLPFLADAFGKSDKRFLRPLAGDVRFEMKLHSTFARLVFLIT